MNMDQGKRLVRDALLPLVQELPGSCRLYVDEAADYPSVIIMNIKCRIGVFAAYNLRSLNLEIEARDGIIIQARNAAKQLSEALENAAYSLNQVKG